MTQGWLARGPLGPATLGMQGDEERQDRAPGLDTRWAAGVTKVGARPPVRLC